MPLKKKARPIRNQTICPVVVSTSSAASTASADPPIIQPDYVLQGMYKKQNCWIYHEKEKEFFLVITQQTLT